MLYRQSLTRIVQTGSAMKLFFRLPPLPGAKKPDGSRDKDNVYWEGIIMPEKIDGVPHDGNFVIKVRRPINPKSPSWEILDKPITSFATFAEGNDH